MDKVPRRSDSMIEIGCGNKRDGLELARAVERYIGLATCPRLEVLALQGIGVCSGIPGDPHDGISRPALLDEIQKEGLMMLELELGRSVPDSGRYILAVGRKR